MYYIFISQNIDYIIVANKMQRKAIYYIMVLCLTKATSLLSQTSPNVREADSDSLTFLTLAKYKKISKK